jgi:hypothetical protein
VRRQALRGSQYDGKLILRQRYYTIRVMVARWQVLTAPDPSTPSQDVRVPSASGGNRPSIGLLHEKSRGASARGTRTLYGVDVKLWQ